MIAYSRSHFDLRLPSIKNSVLWAGTSGTLYNKSSMPSGLCVVTDESSNTARKAVEKLAWYFKREEGYDFVQYLATERDPEARAFLFTAQDWGRDDAEASVGLGACCFTRRDCGRALQWIWLHPYVRRQGILTKVWPFFRERYGDFVVEPPLNDGMKGFMKSVTRASETVPDPRQHHPIPSE
jgi:hypothetical protein